MISVADPFPPAGHAELLTSDLSLQVILRFSDFKLDGTGYGDYVKVYDGLEEHPGRLLRLLTAFDPRAPVAVVSSSGRLRIHFYADKINAARGFNATYQVDTPGGGSVVLCCCYFCPGGGLLPALACVDVV